MANSVLRRRVVQLESKAPPIAGGCRCLGTLALYDEDEPSGPDGRRRVFCSQCGLTKATAHVAIGKQVYAMLGLTDGEQHAETPGMTKGARGHEMGSPSPRA